MTRTCPPEGSANATLSRRSSPERAVWLEETSVFALPDRKHVVELTRALTAIPAEGQVQDPPNENARPPAGRARRLHVR
jgi:hypothetical protein